jgi:hypothetical protein
VVCNDCKPPLKVAAEGGEVGWHPPVMSKQAPRSTAQRQNPAAAARPRQT